MSTTSREKGRNVFNKLAVDGYLDWENFQAFLTACGLSITAAEMRTMKLDKCCMNWKEMNDILRLGLTKRIAIKKAYLAVTEKAPGESRKTSQTVLKSTSNNPEVVLDQICRIQSQRFNHDWTWVERYKHRPEFQVKGASVNVYRHNKDGGFTINRIN